MKNIKINESVFGKLYHLLEREQRRNFILILFLMMISAGLSQLTPKAIGWLTDDILVKNQIHFTEVIPVLALILLVNVGNELIKTGRRLMVEDVATKTEKKARSLAIVSLLQAPLAYFKKHMTGNIHGRLNRCLDGTVKLEKLLFMDLAPAVFNSIAAIIMIFFTLPFTLALPTLLVIPIGMGIVFRQIGTQRGIRVELLETKASMDGTIVELLNGIEVIRISDSIDTEKTRFDTKSEFLRSKEMKHHKQMAKYDILKFMNEIGFTVLLIGISTYLVSKRMLTAGSVLTAYLCFNQLLKPLEELHRILDELSECMILASDFFKIAELPLDFSYIGEPEPKEKTVLTEEGVMIRELSFGYSKDRLILNNINLNIPQGMFLGIAGPSGCGKSSLIKVICKLEKAKGEIRINGMELGELSRKQIAEMIALVPQNPFLVAGTIYENICYGLQREVSMQEVEEAARKACIFDYICSLPKRFQTDIAEGGNNMSGGQKQRIAIARIFLRKPRILILDEATSALDNTSERHIQSEIEKLKDENNMTIISIAHRLTTLKNCDEIIVFNKGQIEQTGKYEELISVPGTFSNMSKGKSK